MTKLLRKYTKNYKKNNQKCVNMAYPDGNDYIS